MSAGYSNFCEIRKCIMWFSGIWPTRMTMIGQVEKLGPEKRSKWGNKIAKLAKTGE